MGKGLVIANFNGQEGNLSNKMILKGFLRVNQFFNFEFLTNTIEINEITN